MVKEVFGVARKIPAYAHVIRYLRESHQMSRQQLASRLAVQDYYIGYMEDGYRFPRPRQVQMLSHIFHWSPFELALMADVEIPYPDWPGLDDLDAWLNLAHQWIGIGDVIHRYTFAKTLYIHPNWLEDLYQISPELRQTVTEYGFIAVYGLVRDRWHALSVPSTRERLPQSLDDILQAFMNDPAKGAAIQEESMPKWWYGLTARQKAAVQTIAVTLAHDPGLPLD